jgi:gas vesicle protein
MYFNNLLDLINRKRRNEERAKTAMKFAVGMGIAASIGLAKGILFAPKSGKETREELKKKAVDTMEVIKAKVRSKAELLKDKTARASQELQNALSPKTTAGKKKK